MNIEHKPGQPEEKGAEAVEALRKDGWVIKRKDLPSMAEAEAARRDLELAEASSSALSQYPSRYVVGAAADGTFAVLFKPFSAY